MKNYSNAARAARRELLATTTLATLAMSPVSLALAQTANPPPAENSGGAIALPTVEVTATQGGGGGGDPEAYSVPNAATATKTNTPIMNTPVSIQVVPQQVLQDQQVVRLDKALENVSSVYTVPSGSTKGASSDQYLIRGFLADRIYRDGVLQPQTFGCCPLSNELADVDHVEVLKGPASILYGRIEPGGLVNIVTKQPLAQPFYALEQQFGSFDLYRTTLDATGPVGADVPLFYRFNMSYENANSFVDLVHNRRFFVAPVLRWEIDPSTQITFNMHYLNSFDPFVGGIPVIGAGAPFAFIPDLPRSRNLYTLFGNPYVHLEDLFFGLSWSHAFNENWTLRQRFSADFLKANSNEDFPFGTPGVDGFVPRSIQNEYSRDALYQTSIDLTGHFTTWDLKHTLLLGADYLNQSTHENSTNFFQIPSINVFTLAEQGGFTQVIPTLHASIHPQWYGIYVQDQIELPFGFHVLAGGRYDNARNPVTTIFEGSPPKYIPNNNSAINPRVGLLWRPIPEMSFYGSYVQNFGLPNGLFQSGTVIQSLPPTTAQQWEAGVKTELFDQKLTATIAWFNLTKQNIPTADPFNPLLSAVTGEVLSRGLEMDVGGQILPGWKVIGGFAYTDAVVLKDTVDQIGLPIGNQGKRFFGVPRFGGSLWTTYAPQEAALQGWTFGAGVVARNDREGDLANTFIVPGFAVANIMASYEWKWGPSKLKLQLNVDNLFDKTYFVNSDGFSNVSFGTPRSFKVALRAEF